MRDFRSLLLAAGIAAPLLYLATVVLGGWLTPDYSHLGLPVSALFAVGAPLAGPVSAAFILYNVLLIAFGLGLWAGGREYPLPLRLAAGMILLNGLFGLVIELFPMDAVGAPVTPTGITHMVLAGLLVLTCTAAMALVLFGWRDRGAFAGGTALLLVLMLAGGALAAMAAAQAWPLVGLFQRITIGSYLVWIAWLALTALRREPAAASA